MIPYSILLCAYLTAQQTVVCSQLDKKTLEVIPNSPALILKQDHTWYLTGPIPYGSKK